MLEVVSAVAALFGSLEVGSSFVGDGTFLSPFIAFWRLRLQQSEVVSFVGGGDTVVCPRWCWLRRSFGGSGVVIR